MPEPLLPHVLAFVTMLALNAYVVLALGVTDGAGLLGASIAVPLSAPRGLPITVQSVAPDANGALKVGAPAVLHVL